MEDAGRQTGLAVGVARQGRFEGIANGEERFDLGADALLADLCPCLKKPNIGIIHILFVSLNGRIKP